MASPDYYALVSKLMRSSEPKPMPDLDPNAILIANALSIPGTGRWTRTVKLVSAALRVAELQGQESETDKNGGQLFFDLKKAREEFIKEIEDDCERNNRQDRAGADGS